MKKLIIVLLVCTVCSLSQAAIIVFETGWDVTGLSGWNYSTGNFGHPGRYAWSAGTTTGVGTLDTGYTILATDPKFQLEWDVKSMDNALTSSEVTGAFGYDAGSGFVSLGGFDASANGFNFTANGTWVPDLFSQKVDNASGAYGQTLLVQFDYTHVTTASNHRVGLDDIAVWVVPEPATMCLLGLGGLLLRRKK